MSRTDSRADLTPIDDAGGHTIYADEDRGTYHAWCDDDAYEPASTAVVIAVASILEVEPDELEALSDAVDPDALDALVGRWRRAAGAPVGTITCSFAAHTVTVRSSGEIAIEPAGQRVRPIDG